VRLEWGRFAVMDRESIFEYIAADNPTAAIELDERFERSAHRLLAHPTAGRLGRLPGTRELVAHPHYVIVYTADAKRVRILRLLHTALHWPPQG